MNAHRKSWFANAERNAASWARFGAAAGAGPVRGTSRHRRVSSSAEAATIAPKTRYPVCRWSAVLEAISTPTVPPIGRPSPTSADAVPRRATGTRSGTIAVTAAW